MAQSRAPFKFKMHAADYVVYAEQLTPLSWRWDFHKTLNRIDARVDVIPYAWNFGGIKGIKKGEVTIQTLYGPVEVQGDIKVFLPAFSILNWSLGPGNIVIETLKSFEPLPDDMPQSPVMFPYSKSGMPKNTAEMVSIVKSAKFLTPLGCSLNPSAPAIRTKRYIDAYYSRPLKLSQIAKELHLSRGVMTRYFHRDFGVSPVAYRNSLRINDSLRYLTIENKSVSEAGRLVGYSDVSTFQKQFKKIIEDSPYNFRKAANPPAQRIIEMSEGIEPSLH